MWFSITTTHGIRFQRQAINYINWKKKKKRTDKHRLHHDLSSAWLSFGPLWVVWECSHSYSLVIFACVICPNHIFISHIFESLFCILLFELFMAFWFKWFENYSYIIWVSDFFEFSRKSFRVAPNQGLSLQFFQNFNSWPCMCVGQQRPVLVTR